MAAPEDHSAIIGKTYHSRSIKTSFGGGLSFSSSRQITFLDDKTYTPGTYVGVSAESFAGHRKDNPDEFGTYELDGFLIRLTPDNGEPDEMLIAFGRESDGQIDYGFMKIGGRSYSLED